MTWMPEHKELIESVEPRGTRGNQVVDEFVGRLYYNEGLYLARCREYDKAIPRLEQAATLCPKLSIPLIVLAKIAIYRGSLSECGSYLDRCSTRPDANSGQIELLRSTVERAFDRARRRERFKAEAQTIGAETTRALSALIAIRIPLGINRCRLLFAVVLVLLCYLATVISA